jgi:hypothetical protein
MNEAAPSRAWMKWTALGCGGFLLLVGLVVALLVIGVRSATAGPEAVVKAFLAAAARGDYAAAHAHFSAPLKEVQSLEAFTAGAEANPSLFDVVDTTFNERSVDMSSATLAGTVTLRAGTELPASFKLVEENDSWKLIAYQIGSD